MVSIFRMRGGGGGADTYLEEGALPSFCWPNLTCLRIEYIGWWPGDFHHLCVILIQSGSS